MTYTVSSGTLNSTIPYHTIQYNMHTIHTICMLFLTLNLRFSVRNSMHIVHKNCARAISQGVYEGPFLIHTDATHTHTNCFNGCFSRSAFVSWLPLDFPKHFITALTLLVAWPEGHPACNNLAPAVLRGSSLVYQPCDKFWECGPKISKNPT